MKIKTSELTGIALDWVVAEAEGGWTTKSPHFHPSIDWREGGPIIERERIGLWSGFGPNEDQWGANKQGIPFECYGPTPLIAAMRCFCISKLGETAEIPEELG